MSSLAEQEEMTEQEKRPLRASMAVQSRVPDAPSRLDAEYDQIVEDIYRAAAGFGPWLKPLQCIAELSGAWALRLLGVDKRTDTLTLHYEAGPRPAESAIDYVLAYHKLDPRLALISSWPVGKWLACQDYFDDDYVARDPFYQNYLVPYGFRYLYGAKVLEDETSVVFLGHHRPPGDPLVDPRQRIAIQRLGRHIGQALNIRRLLAGIVDQGTLGFELLDRLRAPAILLDADRNITFRSKSAQAILDRGDVIHDHHGVLVCRDSESNAELMIAMVDLERTQSGSPDASRARAERRSVRLRVRHRSRFVIGALLALRPTKVMGAFGHLPKVLLTIYEPGAAEEIDPFLVAATFDLTPAEARVAARLTSGLMLEEIAAELKVSISTVRSHLQAVFDKTGTGRQVDLVRLLLTASAFLLR